MFIFASMFPTLGLQKPLRLVFVVGVFYICDNTSVMNIYNFISGNAYWRTNKQLVKKVGCNSAILLSFLIDKRKYYIDSKMIKNLNSPFFATVQDIQDEIGLSEKEQRTAIKKLVDSQLVFLSYKGIPRRRFFVVNDVAIFAVIDSATQCSSQSRRKGGTVDAERAAQETDKGRHIINNKYNNNKKEINDFDYDSIVFRCFAGILSDRVLESQADVIHELCSHEHEEEIDTIAQACELGMTYRPYTPQILLDDMNKYYSAANTFLASYTPDVMGGKKVRGRSF